MVSYKYIKGLINSFQRYQQGFKLIDLFPVKRGECACGCGTKLTGKQTRWASEKCNEIAYNHFALVKGNNGMIRKLVFERDNGFCYECGAFDEKWEADHILEVKNGGGGCTLDNFQTLCSDCHKEKTHGKRN